jgi:hypothetical protein
MVIGLVTQPSDMHAGAWRVRVSINDSQVRIASVECDALFQAVCVESEV